MSGLSRAQPRPSQKRVMGIQEKEVRTGDTQPLAIPVTSVREVVMCKNQGRDVFKAKTLAPPSSPSSLL